MKESYRKGLADHPAPELCVDSRKVAIEALTGAHAGIRESLFNGVRHYQGCRDRIEFSAWHLSFAA